MKMDYRDMNASQAKTMLVKGFRVRHSSFVQGEYITMEAGKLVTDKGEPFSEDWPDKLKEGWSVCEENLKEINWIDELGRLFPEKTTRTLPSGRAWCPSCNGLGLLRLNDTIVGCARCYGKGTIGLCVCGKVPPSHNVSGLCSECHTREWERKRAENEAVAFEKAEKVKYEDYDGKFFIDENVVDKDGFEDWLYNELYEGNDVPSHVWAVEKQWLLSVSINKAIEEACEDGYDGMFENLDLTGIGEIQQMLDAWAEHQGERGYVYHESRKRAILIGELIEGMEKEIAYN